MLHYKVLRSISKGGMGEVYLAYDPSCQREVALKKIRDDLKGHQVIKARFLREAYLTARLTHPGVISIYSIHKEDEELYYVMPYIKGETFKTLLNKAHQKMRTQTPCDETTISALLPIFKSLCQTVSYAHSKGIIHRDLKPENILVGEFGEVIVFDWGLAQTVMDSEEELEEVSSLPPISSEITHPGKIVGTVAYMAPERAKGNRASFQTEVYALGVILYQILTLHLPFDRRNMANFQKNAHLELLPEPEEVAPYRDVPPLLSSIVKRCLDPDPTLRFQSVSELMGQVMSHMEGRAQWFETVQLDVEVKEDWEFQENVLISKHIALTQMTEAAEWVSMMISKVSFGENLRLHTQVRLGSNSEGIGFLLSIPESAEREEPFGGYCLWLGTEDEKKAHLFRNTVEVMQVNDLHLTRGQRHDIAIEKSGNHIYVWLDSVLRLSYLSNLPLRGTHVGLISKDADYTADKIIISVGTENLQISCLAVPDAFLSNKDYAHALTEYRRIAASFPGHAEGREALFRAGVTLLEQAKKTSNAEEKEEIFTLALEEFEKLHHSPAASLEYLGKALLYEAKGEFFEEINCLELALRRYHKHPLIKPIKEQVVYRMHESSQHDRPAAYRLILVMLRHLPDAVCREDSKRLFAHLIKSWEPLSFLENPIDPSMLGVQKEPLEEKKIEFNFAITIAFWLANPHTLHELFSDLLTHNLIDAALISNILFSLCELGATHLVDELIKQLMDEKIDEELNTTLSYLAPLQKCSVEEGIETFHALAPKEMEGQAMRTLIALASLLLDHQKPEALEPLFAPYLSLLLSKEDQIALDGMRIWAFLVQNKLKEVQYLFDAYPLELLNQESTLLHLLYGCYLYLTEGHEIANIHFSGVIETPFPRTWALLPHYLLGNLENWFDQSFLWERRQLYRQLALYYTCLGNEEAETKYAHLAQKQWVHM